MNPDQVAQRLANGARILEGEQRHQTEIREVEVSVKFAGKVSRARAVGLMPEGPEPVVRSLLDALSRRTG